MPQKRSPNLGYTAQALHALTAQVEQLVLATRQTDQSVQALATQVEQLTDTTRQTDLALIQTLERIQAINQQVGDMVVLASVDLAEARLDIAQLIEGCRRQNDELAELRRMLGATGPAPRRSSEPPAEEAAA